jgi:hypothetical protein
MPKYGMETSDITSQKEVQNTTISGKNDFDTFLGCARANFGILPRERRTTVTVTIMLQGQFKPDA